MTPPDFSHSTPENSANTDADTSPWGPEYTKSIPEFNPTEAARRISEVQQAQRTRNSNAEWEILQKAAQYSTTGLEYFNNPEKRAAHRKLGEHILSVLINMPKRADKTIRNQTLADIHHAAETEGVADALQETIQKRLHPPDGVKIGEATFNDDNSELSPEELAAVEALKQRVIDLTEVAPGALSSHFPSGNYLYHGSPVARIERIFQSGGLKNGMALLEDNPGISAFDLNSGFEGLSWSMDKIDALPGTRGHIAGFVAAPEDIMTDTEQLVIPSRPAPYEVLQINGDVNATELYHLKNQYETWGDGAPSIGEKNNVFSNLMRMMSYREGHKFFTSLVYQYQGDTSAETLREHFTTTAEGELVFDENLSQKFDLPPALPWFQSLIDSGALARGGYEDLTTVDSVVNLARQDKDFLLRLLATAKVKINEMETKYDAMTQKISTVRVRPESMYFVTSHRDLEPWLRVMARTGVTPKGILLYDDDAVIMENFASDYEGNHEDLSTEIGSAIGVNNDFWPTEMGFDPANIPRSGDKGQVLLETQVKHDKSLRMIDGKLTVVTTPTT